MTERFKLEAKIKSLSKTLWDNRVSGPILDAWLDNFDGKCIPDREREQILALFLLSQFSYFGYRQIRELLKVLYRDLYRYPIIKSIRKSNNDTLDGVIIEPQFDNVLNSTRFLAFGNPSESGTHLLYYFRQENNLKANNIIHVHDIFEQSLDGGGGAAVLKDKSISRYVFIDDFCGSGTQAIRLSEKGTALPLLKKLHPDIKLSYYVLFATQIGLSKVKNDTVFDDVKAVHLLDDSFHCFDINSRYFGHEAYGKNESIDLCFCYGKKLKRSDPLGFKCCQLLLGFHHNIPNNSLPIFWSGNNWVPIFPRYNKCDLSRKGAK